STSASVRPASARAPWADSACSCASDCVSALRVGCSKTPAMQALFLMLMAGRALAHLPDDLAAIAGIARTAPADLASALDHLARLEVTDVALLLRLLGLGHGSAPPVESRNVLGRDGSTTRPGGGRSGPDGKLHRHTIGLTGTSVLVARGELGDQEHAESPD